VPKATLKLPSGTIVSIEGSVEEVEDLLHRVEGRARKGPLSEKGKKKKTKETDRAIGDYVLELREAGLFEKPQGLTDIKNALQAEGHIVPITTLSGVMLRLVKTHELRRFKESGTWKYGNR